MRPEEPFVCVCVCACVCQGGGVSAAAYISCFLVPLSELSGSATLVGLKNIIGENLMVIFGFTKKTPLCFVHTNMRVRRNIYMCVRACIHWVLHSIFMRARKKRTNPRTRTLVCMRYYPERWIRGKGISPPPPPVKYSHKKDDHRFQRLLFFMFLGPPVQIFWIRCCSHWL